MKTIRILLTACAVVLACGCDKLEDRTGNVGYIYYAVVEDGGGESDARAVSDIYTEQFRLIKDADVKDGHLYLYGKYGDLDNLVLEACRKADEQIVASGFKPEKKCTFTVNAIYTMEVVANFYVKTY